MKRLILVAQEHRQYLHAAVTGAAAAAGRDVYEVVKQYLRSKGIAHEDRTMRPADVPSHKAHWHA